MTADPGPSLFRGRGKRLLHPASGVLATYLGREERRTFRRLHRLWYPLLVAAPLALGLLSVLGYFYTAGVLLKLLVNTAWMIVGLVLLSAFARRWLRVIRRRLAFEAAIKRKEAMLESRQHPEEGPGTEETGAFDVEEEEVDLEDLTDASEDLIHTAIVTFGLVGLWMIWSEALPALRVFDDVALWHQTVIVDDQEKIDPITLAELGLALIYGILTVLLAKQLPAVLEIVLLDHTEMSAGDRYTVVTLTTYTLITIGLVLVFRTVGADWSKLQWLIAALGVGIGFGLQEIVANFISGIILLEEAARENEVVLNDPAPSVIFEAFGDSSLSMLLRCFVDSVDVRFRTISALNQAINDKFNAAGIVIAFPQRDLHLDTNGPLHVTISSDGQAPSFEVK